MIVRLSSSRYSEESIFLTVERESWNLVSDDGLAFFSNIPGGSKQDATHQDESFRLRRHSLNVRLSHYTSKRMSGQINFITSKAFGSQALQSVLNVMVDKKRFGKLKEEIWNANPSLITFTSGCRLEFFRNLSVSLGIAVSTDDPNHCNWFASQRLIRCKYDICLDHK